MKQFGRHLEAIWSTQAALGPFGALWDHLGGFKRSLEALGGHLGATWEVLGEPLGRLGSQIGTDSEPMCSQIVEKSQIRTDSELICSRICEKSHAETP